MPPAREWKNILVVAPGRDLEAMMPRLEDRGWTVRRCSGLLRAMVRLDRRSPDAILVDGRKVSGLEEALPEIRSLVPDVAVVVVSDSRARHEGADARMVARDDLPRLEEILEEAHSQRSARAQARRLVRTMDQIRERLEGQAAYAEELTEATSRWRKAVLQEEELYGSLVDTFRDMTGAERVSLMLRDEENRELLTMVCGRGIPDRVVGKARLRFGDGIAGRAVQQGMPLDRKPPDVESRAARHHEFRSNQFLCLPLRTGHEVLGVMNLSEPRQMGALTGTRKEFLKALAREAAAWVKLGRRLQRLRQQTIVDDLTGVYNRRLLNRELKKELQRAKRSRRGLALAMVDIDDLKGYNDTYGHSAGDKALRAVARLIQENLRKTDTVCRYGGDEFVALLPDTSRSLDLTRRRATEVMERVRRAVDEHGSRTGNARLEGLSVSAGVALFRRNGIDAESLLRRADRLLYKAKRAGGNRVCSAAQ
ncbi:MAG: sensor domain-containing diguanylate cyclase [Planctomycetota bacterium]